MSNEELELKLIKGIPVTVDGIRIKPMLVEQIIDDTVENGIGYDKYVGLINILGIDKKNLQNITPEQLEEIKTFDIFLFNAELMESLIEFLKVFLNHNKIEYMADQQLILIDYSDTLACIYRDNYDSIMNVFRKMYCISINQKEVEYNPANDKARELIEHIKRRDEELARIKGKTAPNLFSIISGVAWKSHNINIFDIFKLTIFQLYDAYYRLEIIDNCTYTMTGIYTGNIEAKSIKQEELTWIKKYNPFS